MIFGLVLLRTGCRMRAGSYPETAKHDELRNTIAHKRAVAVRFRRRPNPYLFTQKGRGFQNEKIDSLVAEANATNGGQGRLPHC